MATELEGGGPAFPHTARIMQRDANGTMTPVGFEGMSLRDWFAGQAISGAAYMLGVTEPITAAMDRRSLCESAYAIADEMLRARKAEAAP